MTDISAPALAVVASPVAAATNLPLAAEDTAQLAETPEFLQLLASMFAAPATAPLEQGALEGAVEEVADAATLDGNLLPVLAVVPTTPALTDPTVSALSPDIAAALQAHVAAVEKTATPAMEPTNEGSEVGAVSPSSSGREMSVPQAVNPQAVNPQAVNPQAVNPQAVNPQAVNPRASTAQPVSHLAAATTVAAAAKPALANEADALMELAQRAARNATPADAGKLAAVAPSGESPAPTVEAPAPSVPAFAPMRGAEGASAPMARYEVATPVADRAWPEAFSNRVMLMVNGRDAAAPVQNAEIRLNPASLGPIEVRVSMVDGQANVSFHAAHAGTRDAIESAMPRLKDMLEGAGLTLGNVDVSAQSFAERQQREGAPAQNPATGRLEGLGLEEPNAPASRAPIPSRIGGLDIYV